MKKAALLLISLCSCLLLGNQVNSPDYMVGDEIKDFHLPSTKGGYISLDSLGDAKGFIVIFTSNECPYSQLYEDRLIALHNKYAPLGFPLIAINPNSPEILPEESFEHMLSKDQEKSFPFHYLYDEDQKIYKQFGATRTPHAFVISQDRIVEYIGAIDDNPESANLVKRPYVENAVNALLLDEYPEVEYTHAVGCMIQAKPDSH